MRVLRRNAQQTPPLSGVFAFPAMHTSNALPSHFYRDPMLVLERKQEEEAAAEKREQARKVARMSLARLRAESLFTKDAD